MAVRPEIRRIGSARRLRGAGALAWLLALAVAPRAEAATVAYVVSELADSISVVDADAGVSRGTIRVGEAPVAIAAGCDGRRVYVANFASESVSVIDTASNRVVSVWRLGQPPTSITVGPDCLAAFVGLAGPGEVAVVDLASGAIRRRTPVDAIPEGLAPSADGKDLYVASRLHDSVAVLDVASGDLRRTVDLFAGSGPYRVAFGTEGGRAYFADVDSNVLSVVSVADGVVQRTVPSGNSPAGIVELPGSVGARLLVASSQDDSVHVVVPDDYAVEATIPVGRWPVAIRVDPSRILAGVANFSSSEVSLIDMATLEVRSTVAVDRGPRDLVFVELTDPAPVAPSVPAPEANAAETVFLRTNDRQVYVVDMTAGTKRLLMATSRMAQLIEARSDGSRLYVAALTKVQAVDPELDRIVAEVDTGTARILRLSGDERTLFVVKSGPEQLVVLDARTLAVRSRFNLDFQPVALAVSRRGDRAYVSWGESDGAGVIAIDTATNREVARYPLADVGQGFLELGADDRLLFAASYSGSIVSIDTATGAVLGERALRDRIDAMQIGAPGRLGVLFRDNHYRIFEVAGQLLSKLREPAGTCSQGFINRRVFMPETDWVYFATPKRICAVNVLTHEIANAVDLDFGFANPSPVELLPVRPSRNCTGDCDADGVVTVEEIVRAVSIGLGAADATTCASADADGDRTVTVDELISAVLHALEGCG